MNAPLLQTILTQIIDKHDKGLIRDSEDHLSTDNKPSFLIHNRKYNDFYFIADKNTLPKNLDDYCIINGVKITIYRDLVRIYRVSS